MSFHKLLTNDLCGQLLLPILLFIREKVTSKMTFTRLKKEIKGGGTKRKKPNKTRPHVITYTITKKQNLP
jgi:hypothetical protein